MRASAKFQRGEKIKKKTSKSLHGGYKNIIKKKRLVSSQLVETSSSFGGGSGRGMDVGAAAVYRSLIYDPLSFACVFTGFWELHSIRAAGVRSMFSRG